MKKNDSAVSGDKSDCVKLSVAVCTFNRFGDLRNVLDGLNQQTIPGDQVEVLVIDNGTDRAAAREFVQSFPLEQNVRWLESSPPGLSRARNVALRQASAPIVAFIDDDAVPAPEWAENLLRSFEEYPEAALVGGPVEPRWDKPRPDWIPSQYESFLGILDLGDQDLVLGNDRYGIGANLAVRREVALGVGGFDEAIGRIGDLSLLSNEEIALQDRLRAAGYSLRYAAKARVYHRIQAERLTRNWFRARVAWQVVSVALQNDGWPWAAWSQWKLRHAAAALGMADTVGTMFAPRGNDVFSDQLDVLQHLFALLLVATREPDDFLENLFVDDTEELSLRHALDQARDANDIMQAEVDSLRALVERQRVEINSAAAALNSTEQRLAAVYGSASWRLTAPLRAIFRWIYNDKQ